MTNENPPDCLILAGGLSRRMGFDKASVNMDGQTLLSRMVGVMKEHGMRTCVVLGPNSDERDIDPDSVMVVRNKKPDLGRTGSIQIGLEALGWPEKVIIAPIDRPGFSSKTLIILMKADSSSCPEKDGRGGHPVMLDWRGIAAIKEAKPSSSLKDLIKFSRFEVEDPHIHINLDTPEDVIFLKKAWDEIYASWKVNSKRQQDHPAD